MEDQDERTVADRCKATCRYLACTGLGSLEPWAHECIVVGIPRATPTCAVDGCSEPGALMPRGRRCRAHRPAQPVPGPPTRPSPKWIWPLAYGPAETSCTCRRTLVRPHARTVVCVDVDPLGLCIVPEVRP